MLTRRLGALGIALLAATVIACAPAPTAAATRGLTLGFSADPHLTGGTTVSRAPWITRAISDGASIVRVNVDWRQVAPAKRRRGFDAANPGSSGYKWAAVDDVIRDLTSHGLRVLVTVWDAPAWAEGPHKPRAERPGTWRPDPGEFGAFAKAAALRYDGRFPDPQGAGTFLPAVHLWQGWNEPNLDYYLSPQWVRAGRGWSPVAPVVYRHLLNAFYSAVKGVSRSNLVVMAGTAPYGDPIGSDPPGQERVPPVAFYRNMFCLAGARSLTPVSCPDPAHLDALDHHPYGIGGPTWRALNADDVAVPDVYKIARVLRAGVRAGHVLPRGPKGLWVSEIGWSSKPPNPQGVPVTEDARWLEQAMYVLWAQGVNTVLPLEIGDPTKIFNYSSVFESGLYYRDGRAKPLAQAFRFPFITERLRGDRIRAWGRSPEDGQLQVEVLHAGHWRTVAHLHVGQWQVFTANLRLAGRASLRAQVGSNTSLTWIQGA